jgi:hypothetical protein
VFFSLKGRHGKMAFHQGDQKGRIFAIWFISIHAYFLKLHKQLFYRIEQEILYRSGDIFGAIFASYLPIFSQRQRWPVSQKIELKHSSKFVHSMTVSFSY